MPEEVNRVLTDRLSDVLLTHSPEAIDNLRRAITLQPSLSQAHYRLALVYQRTGRKDLAAKELETFRQLTAASGGDKQ